MKRTKLTSWNPNTRKVGLTHRLITVSLLVLLILPLATIPASSNVKSDWTKNGVLVCDATDTQEYPDIVSDGLGGAIITWSDGRDGGSHIYAQRVSPSGKVKWGTGGVTICDSSISQSDPRIVSDGNGGAIITWMDSRVSALDDIYAQRIDANGNVLWQKNGVPVCDQSDEQVWPRIIADGTGGAIIVWRDGRHGSTRLDIYAQRVDSNGNSLWTDDGKPVCKGDFQAGDPQLVSDGAGGAIITWNDERSDPNHSSIYAQRVKANGSAAWKTNGIGVCTATGTQYSQRIISDGLGGAIIAWDDMRPGDDDIYVQRVDPAGNALWKRNGVPIDQSEISGMYGPQVVTDGFNGAIIVWDGGPAVYAQRVGPSGRELWIAGGVECNEYGGSPVVVANGSGGAIIAWGQLGPNNTRHIYTQQIDTNGFVQGDINGTVVCSSNKRNINYRVAPDGEGGALVTWTSLRGSTGYTYTQRMAAIPNDTYYSAEGSCRAGFNTYLCIQNPSEAEADVRITYVTGDGKTKEQDVSVAPSSRYTVDVRNIIDEGNAEAKDFSAKIECTNNQAIVCERPVYFNYYNEWSGGHDIVAPTSPSTRYYFAEGTCRPDFDPYFRITNYQEENAEVRITFMTGDGEVKEQEINAPPGQAPCLVNIKDILGVGNDAAHDFSATIESTNNQPIVCERPMYFNYKQQTPGYGWAGGHNVVGITSRATTYYFAEGSCRPNFEPYICIQNPSEEDAHVKITYMTGDGKNREQLIDVSSKSRYTVVVKEILGEGNDAAHDFSAKVEALNGVEIIAERPMYFIYKPGDKNWAGGHDVIGTPFTSTQFSFAEGNCFPNNDPYLCIQNPGDEDANITIQYMRGDDQPVEQHFVVTKRSRYTVVVKDILGEGTGPAYEFAAKVRCTNGQHIICERPMYFNYQDQWPGGHDVIGVIP